jgi:hypothetical protein
MTPNAFVLEYWKVYEAYLERKERLIEVATTLYLAFLSALLLHDDLWRCHFLAVPALTILTALLVWCFVLWQMGLRHQARKISESSQSLMGEWLFSAPAEKDASLQAESRPKEFEAVKLPKALWVAMEVWEERQSRLGCCDRVKAWRFNIVVYGLLGAWTLLFLGRVTVAWREAAHGALCIF